MTALLPPAPRELPADATAEGLAFHRLVYARRGFGWWTPLVTGLLGVVIFLGFTIVLIVIVAVVAIANPEYADKLTSANVPIFDLTDPFFTALLLVSIAVMWPSYLLASLVVNGPRIGLISSVAGRLRWKWMLMLAGVAVGVYVVISALTFLIPADESSGGNVVAPGDNPAFVWTLLIIVLLVPFQSAAEEYVFRGYLQQMIGRWLRHPAWAILLPVPLFVLGHVYDVLGQTSVAVFAVAAGWLTWRTGGLEAAIALHVVNNLFAFGLSTFGLSDPNATDTGIISLVSSVVMIGVYVALVEVLWRRGAQRRTLRLTPPAPTPMPMPYGSYAGGYPTYAPHGYAPLPYGQPGQAPQAPHGQPAQPPYGQPPQAPYGQPVQAPYGQPAQAPYGQPAQVPYGQPPQAPYGQPAQPPYGQAPVASAPAAPAPAGPPRQAPRWGEYAPGYPLPEQPQTLPSAAPAGPASSDRPEGGDDTGSARTD
ncbi:MULTISPECIES: type II CAAX prenyl endopeptidase Rce1 family protein [unclassified Microbacterium]|uniref:CPBP family intramembrane glutamic endopeptidase n=1 Tax=unclassified Microbacterium TaxID=2609290 RepID=UPI00386F3667